MFPTIFNFGYYQPEPKVKFDCYWYRDYHDMNAMIPTCRLHPDEYEIDGKICKDCKEYHSKWHPTKADEIRKMSDEQLVSLLADNGCPAGETSNGECLKEGSITCEQCWLQFLRMEVAE